MQMQMQNQDLKMRNTKSTEDHHPFLKSTSKGILTASTGFSESDVQMTDEMSSPSEISSQNQNDTDGDFSAHNKNFSVLNGKLNKLEDQLYSYLFRNLS